MSGFFAGFKMRPMLELDDMNVWMLNDLLFIEHDFINELFTFQSPSPQSHSVRKSCEFATLRTLGWCNTRRWLHSVFVWWCEWQLHLLPNQHLGVASNVPERWSFFFHPGTPVFTSHVDDQQLYQAGGDVSLHLFHDGKIGLSHPPTCLLFDKSRPLKGIWPLKFKGFWKIAKIVVDFFKWMVVAEKWWWISIDPLETPLANFDASVDRSYKQPTGWKAKDQWGRCCRCPWGVLFSNHIVITQDYIWYANNGLLARANL